MKNYLPPIKSRSDLMHESREPLDFDESKLWKHMMRAYENKLMEIFRKAQCEPKPDAYWEDWQDAFMLQITEVRRMKDHASYAMGTEQYPEWAGKVIGEERKREALFDLMDAAKYGVNIKEAFLNLIYVFEKE